MKFTVTATASTTGPNTTIESEGVPFAVEENLPIKLTNATTSDNYAFAVLQKSAIVSHSLPLPVSITMTDQVNGSATFTDANVLNKFDFGAGTFYLFTYANPAGLFRGGERGTVEIEFDDSLLIEPKNGELSIISPIMRPII